MNVPVHGNFRRYYGMRRARVAGTTDPAPGRADDVDERIIALVEWCGTHASLLRPVERVLDVGCNAAKPLLELCQLMKPPPSYAEGVDIDSQLVRQARSALRRAWSQREPASTAASVEAMHYFPRCFGSLMGQLPLPPSASLEPGPAFPTNISFIEADWVRTHSAIADSANVTENSMYDLILCFSLNKWVHLNQGDEGLVRLLARLASNLRTRGIVALEVQPWRSYSQARTLSRDLRRNHARLRLRPDDIGWIFSLLGLECLGPIAQGTGYGTSDETEPS